MEVAIENIASLAAVGNLTVNQLMECKITMAVITKVVIMEEPKWTTVMAKNVRQVVIKAMETLADAPKHEVLPALHELWNQGRWDWEGASATTQHKNVVRLDETTRQGRCHHAIVAWRAAAQASARRWAHALARWCSSLWRMKTTRPRCGDARALQGPS